MLTGTHSEAASYEFTTLTCIPGIIHYNDTKIQLLDLPGIIEGASEGKGRGRQVIAVNCLFLNMQNSSTHKSFIDFISFFLYIVSIFRLLLLRSHQTLYWWFWMPQRLLVNWIFFAALLLHSCYSFFRTPKFLKHS